MQQTIEFRESASRQTSLQLPAILSDAELQWLGDHNASLTIEQTADARLIMTPATGSLGNRGEIRLITQLSIWNNRTRFGEIRGLTGGVLLPKGGKYQVDGFVISAKEWAKIPLDLINAPYPPALPTAAFELLSPANVTARGYTIEFTKKLQDYASSAVPLVVLLNPKNEHAIIRRPGRPEETTTSRIVTFPELPGLKVNVGEIYDDCNNRFAFQPEDELG